MNNEWIVICNKKRAVPFEIEPCWFFNNGGCKHKDGTSKAPHECKYAHVYTMHAKKPPHLSVKKPCDKFNLEGECKWYDDCKYSHKQLTMEEWSFYYPGIPFTLKTTGLSRAALEQQILDLEGRIKILEYKQDCVIQLLAKLRDTCSAEEPLRGVAIGDRSVSH